MQPSRSKLRIPAWFTTACLAATVSCASVPRDSVVHQSSVDASRPRGARPEAVHVLGPSVDALRTAFNRAKGRPRLIALLSPSCPRCMASSDSILKALHGAPDGVDPVVLVVWLEVFATDDAETCSEGMTRFAGTPTQGFLDDQRLAGRLLTRGRLPIGVARHLFLWYDPDAEWGERPPEPEGWGHQLRRHDPDAFVTCEELEQRLTRVFAK